MVHMEYMHTWDALPDVECPGFLNGFACHWLPKWHEKALVFNSIRPEDFLHSRSPDTKAMKAMALRVPRPGEKSEKPRGVEGRGGGGGAGCVLFCLFLIARSPP